MTSQIERKTEQHKEEVAAQDVVDFKMVTFTLGGKDYGIDIMRVKEIAKFQQFTYVPNTAPYVRGVYNLRGDIISIIDFRLMFNVPVEEKPEGKAENGLILRLEQNQLGVVVDSIDKVVGFSSRQIQPPHPIFGDINIKFISGVVEHQGRLYIILDVDRIFQKEEKKPAERPTAAETVEEEPEEKEGTAEATSAEEPPPEAINREFLQEALSSFRGFYVSGVNDQWFISRMGEWELSRREKGLDVQITDRDEAEAFLAPFWSRCNGSFWEEALLRSVSASLPDLENSLVHVWNPGCGGGHESYSLAVLLRERYPDVQLKIWAGDTDLMKISTAPNLVFQEGEVPASWSDYLVSGRNGYSFSAAITDLILFEFSDVLNGTALPRMDMIVSRDVVSTLEPAKQVKFFATLEEVLKPSGLLMLGENEQPLDMSSWELIDDTISMYRFR
ncbi:MAG: chemotaxis protein CheR [Spirochaetaceae bacterium]|nr:MAG: chemotaxis protein CheR [Spirochaetaceae bacterium]